MAELLSFTKQGYQFAWDSTSLSNFVTCPRKYQMQNLHGWQKRKKSVHLIFGGLYASALENFHKLIVVDGLEYWDAAREILHKLLKETWEYDLDEEGHPIPGTGGPVDWAHASKTRDTLVRSVIWYMHHFEDDQMEVVVLDNGKPAVELSFTIELEEGSEFIYCGHMDKLVNYGGAHMVQDQKTSGSTITPRFFDSFTPDYQMTGYILASQIIFNVPAKVVCVDAAQIAVGFTEFTRGTVSRQRQTLEEFRHEVIHYAKQAKACHENDYYPMNRKSCDNYGGCEFRNICAAIPENRESLLSVGFERRPVWDPLKRR